MTPASRQKWITVAIVAVGIAVAALAMWPRPIGPVAGAEPRLINIVFTLALLVTGPILWARAVHRFRGVQWLRQAAATWIHRLVGLAYFPIILLWDFFFETGNAEASEPAILEALNKPVLVLILATSAFLFLRWPRPLLRYYTPIKYVHIVTALVYGVKFFAEPLLGGRLG